MSLVTYILWFVLSVLLGFLGFLMIPIAAASMGPSRRHRVASWLFDLSMSSFRRVLCLVNKHGDAALRKSSFDVETQAEKLTINDEPHYFEDTNGWMLTCHNKPFGFVQTERNRIVHPMVAEIGAAIDRRDERGLQWKQFVFGGEDPDEETVIDAMNAHIVIDRALKAVDLRGIKRATNEQHEPNDPHKAEENVKKSQLGYKGRSVLSMVMVLVALGIGAGLAWFIWSNTDSTGGESVVELPVTMLVDVLGVLI